MAKALEIVHLNDGFSPAEIGKRVGLSKPQAEFAARELSNAGVLELGFDCMARFSSDFRKARAKTSEKPGQRKRVATARHKA